MTGMPSQCWGCQEGLTPGSCAPRWTRQLGWWRGSGRCSGAQWAGGRSRAGGRGQRRQGARSAAPAESGGRTPRAAPSQSTGGAVTAAVRVITARTAGLIMLSTHNACDYYYRYYIWRFKKTFRGKKGKWRPKTDWHCENKTGTGIEQSHNPSEVILICWSSNPTFLATLCLHHCMNGRTPVNYAQLRCFRNISQVQLKSLQSNTDALTSKPW